MSYARWLQLGSFRVSTTVTTSWLIIAVLAIVSYFLTRNLKKVPTSKVQIFLEYADNNPKKQTTLWHVDNTKKKM